MYASEGEGTRRQPSPVQLQSEEPEPALPVKQAKPRPRPVAQGAVRKSPSAPKTPPRRKSRSSSEKTPRHKKKRTHSESERESGDPSTTTDDGQVSNVEEQRTLKRHRASTVTSQSNPSGAQEAPAGPGSEDEYDSAGEGRWAADGMDLDEPDADEIERRDLEEAKRRSLQDARINAQGALSTPGASGSRDRSGTVTQQRRSERPSTEAGTGTTSGKPTSRAPSTPRRANPAVRGSTAAPPSRSGSVSQPAHPGRREHSIAPTSRSGSIAPRQGSASRAGLTAPVEAPLRHPGHMRDPPEPISEHADEDQDADGEQDEEEDGRDAAGQVTTDDEEDRVASSSLTSIGDEDQGSTHDDADQGMMLDDTELVGATPIAKQNTIGVPRNVTQTSTTGYPDSETEHYRGTTQWVPSSAGLRNCHCPIAKQNAIGVPRNGALWHPLPDSVLFCYRVMAVTQTSTTGYPDSETERYRDNSHQENDDQPVSNAAAKQSTELVGPRRSPRKRVQGLRGLVENATGVPPSANMTSSTPSQARTDRDHVDKKWV
ncbi:hypothetical protein BC835DRAFT_1310966 [Cytidiella melzeri]|nr:hypothetical protein BC835DRAFT_1310966 [Cytidiella melzeri]